MAIFENIEELKKFIPFNGSYDIENLKPSIEDANLEYIYPVCGDILSVLESEASGENSEIKNKARKELQRALGNLGSYLNIPFMSVMISNAGVTVSEGSNEKAASNAQLNDLKRHFLNQGNKALDRLLKILESSPDIFENWANDYLPIYNELLVKDTDTFNKYFFIHYSRQTFISLTPTMREVEDKYLKNFLCSDFLVKIKNSEVSLNESEKEVKHLVQKAIVAFTVSKIVVEGQYVLDPKGIHLKFDTLPHETSFGAKRFGNDDFLKRTSATKEAAGYEYLKSVKKLIEKNPDHFSECDGSVLLEKNSSGANPVSNRSILAL